MALRTDYSSNTAATIG